MKSLDERSVMTSSAKLYVSIASNLSNEDEYYGTLRNAQLVKVFFPGWKLRVYTSGLIKKSIGPKFDKLRRKISYFDGEVIAIEEATMNIVPLSALSYLIQDDPGIDAYIVRSPVTRLSDRDATAVKEWLETGKAVHIINDHQVYTRLRLLPHLWGARKGYLRDILKTSMLQFIRDSTKKHSDVCAGMNRSTDAVDIVIKGDRCLNLLNEDMRSATAHNVHCHGNDAMCHPLPSIQKDEDILGWPWDGHGTPLNVTFTV